jgi:hypothetical protein
METSSVLLAAALALGACTPNVPEKKPPKGAVIETLAAGSASVVVETIEPAASASPEALRQYLLSKAPIDQRQALNDGFATTFGGETHVLRERRNRWYHCHAAVTDDAMRDEVIAACKSYKLPAGP